MSGGPAIARPPGTRRVLVLGATGTIGRATARALAERGHDVICLVRPRTDKGVRRTTAELASVLPGAEMRFGEATDPASLARDGFRGERFDAVVSCLASRTGAPRDAWRVDHDANINVLAAARTADVGHMILLSAICVQRPRLEFQRAKLAFEEALVGSGLTYSIVRPTAYFKSLSGQIDRLRRGKPFLVFGDGRLTRCKPIGDDDLGAYLADCLDDESRHDRILPIGGPGDAITPRQQGEHLAGLFGRAPRFTHVPVALLDAVVVVLSGLGRVVPRLADKAELARIGRYYATESMLVLDERTGRYDADATPSTGSETLFDFQARLVRGEVSVDRGDHAVFRSGRADRAGTAKRARAAGGRRKWRGAMVAIVSGVLTTGCSVFGIRTASEPRYTTERTIGPVEIRRYGPRVAAQTDVAGDEIRARRVGFERLAGYIFGGNEGARSIAMTAPVGQAGDHGAGAARRSIAMTAPVGQASSVDGQARGGSGPWRIRFFMPAGETIATLPHPDDPAVTLTTVPAETVAVLRYAGTPTADAVRDNGAKLLRSLAGSGLTVEGVPFAWFYDPPWTIPALRRNEAVVRIGPG